MLTERSILSLCATSTATQCSAALPTIATTIAPMKNSDRPSDSEAAPIDPTRTSDITPTTTPATASIATERRTDQPHDPLLVIRGSWAGSRWVLQREVQPDHVDDDQDGGDQAGEELDRRAELDPLGADGRQPVATRELEDRGHGERGGGQPATSCSGRSRWWR